MGQNNRVDDACNIGGLSLRDHEDLPSAADADLPPRGTRITPAKSAIMPKLIGPDSGPVVYTDTGAHHSGGGFNIAGPDDSSPSQPSRRILIKNNLIADIDGDKWGSATPGPADGRFAQLVGEQVNITIDHNTIFHSGAPIVANGAPSAGFVFRNNVARNNLYGVSQSGAGLSWFLFPRMRLQEK